MVYNDTKNVQLLENWMQSEWDLEVKFEKRMNSSNWSGHEASRYILNLKGMVENEEHLANRLTTVRKNMEQYGPIQGIH